MSDGRRLVGVVLAGGRSRRMGTTKALVPVEGRPMAERVLEAVRVSGCDPVVLLGGDPDELAVLGAPVWPDRHPDAGPVGGVCEALRRTAAEHPDATAVVVTACDLPWLDPAVVRELVASLSERPDADVCLARTDRLEPLCGVWRPGVADVVEEAFHDGTRAMHRLIDLLVCVAVDVDPAVVRNVNTPDDLPDGEIPTSEAEERVSRGRK